jgi:tetratricopeptide (TPR) repeat protein
MNNEGIRRRRIGVVFALYLFISASFALGASDLTARNVVAAGSTINGMVFDAEKRGLADIDVEFQDDLSRFLARARTSGGGRFTFSNLSAGTYQVRVVAERFGYAEQSQSVEIMTFNRGSAGVSSDTVYLDFYLQPLKGGSFAEAVGLTGSIFAQEVPEPARSLYVRALLDFNQKKPEAGIAKLQEALEIFPQYFYALNRLGDEFIKKQEYEAAYELLLRATEVNPKAADSFYLLGYAQYMLKQYEPAAAALRRSIIWDQRSAAALLLLGMALRQTGKYDEAESRMLRANELSKKKSADVHWQLALLYGNNLKKYTEAADELELFLKYQPDSKGAEAIKNLIRKFREKAKAGS